MENTTAPIADQFSKPKDKLRWYQYSLRTLLICVTLFAVFCSWFAVKKQQADRQKKAVQALESHGYHIGYYYGDYATVRSYDDPMPAPDWFVSLVGKDFLYDVHSVGETISLPTMKFHVPAMTDADMVAFDQLPQLQNVRFRNIRGNPAKITDEGISHLVNLKDLEFLDLSDTLVTDAGLKHLEGLWKLEELYLHNTHVTETGVRKLQNVIPNLKIYYSSATGSLEYPYEWSEEESLHIEWSEVESLHIITTEEIP